jgi:hypothetical protein
MTRRVFVIHPIGVRQAADLDGLKIDIYGRPQRKVHVRGSLKPVWVDDAQVRAERYDAEEGRRVARTYRDRVRANLTMVDALVELDRIAIGELPSIDTTLVNDLVTRWRATRAPAAAKRRAA